MCKFSTCSGQTILKVTSKMQYTSQLFCSLQAFKQYLPQIPLLKSLKSLFEEMKHLMKLLLSQKFINQGQSQFSP